MKRSMKNRIKRTLPVIHPNVGIRVAYRKAMEYHINQMCDDVERQLTAFFNGRENRLGYESPLTAEDAWLDYLPEVLGGGKKQRSPKRSVAEMLVDLMDRLTDKWERRFETASKGIVSTFINGIFNRVRSARKKSLEEAGIKVITKQVLPGAETANKAVNVTGVAGAGLSVTISPTGKQELNIGFPVPPEERPIKSDKESLRKMGIAIPFDKSRATNEWFQAAIQRNVGLIKTIPEQYLGRVNEMVMQAITAGYDRAGLQQEIYTLLTEKLAWEREKALKRANIIARDQIQKATQEFSRHTDVDNGITKGKWVHIPGRIMSRPTHIEMNGKEFDLRVGLYDSDPKVRKKVKPGECILCACGYRAVIPDDWF